MQKHKILSRTSVQQPFFNLENLEVQHPNKDLVKTFIIANHGDWVNVVAETEDGKVVLIEQWRAGIDDLSIEVPGGKIDEGEDPAAAGLRELEEETGFTLTEKSKVIDLGFVYANPAIQTNKMFYIYVNNVKRTKETDFDDMEVVYTHVYDKERVASLLSTNQIKHSYSVLALYKTFKG